MSDAQKKDKLGSDPGGPDPSGRHARLTDPAPPSDRSGGLKLVTIAPAQSVPDLEDDFIAAQSGRKVDPYLNCVIDERYHVETILGEGGMGVVYRCRHRIIGKKVAMKVLRANMAQDAELTERFLNEAKAASAIGNPHIIDISDFGQLPDGSTYFVMEYLDGVPLSEMGEEGKPIPVSRILHIAEQLTEGLQAAHNAGIVHRDLKPDNIFLIARGSQKDFVKILDFGIAKVSSSGEGKLTRAGAVFGTPHYMSPEQAAGAPVDHRGDIYSLGVIFYELASGRVPFDADNFMGILTQHMYKAPVPLRALVPEPQEVPPGLEAVVLKCLSKRPEQRYQSMAELAEDLRKLRDGLVPEAVPEMMGRSGGFNVPTGYFKSGSQVKGMPAPFPAAPAGAPRSRWPFYAGIVGVATAVVIVVGIFAKSETSVATPAPAARSAAPALAPTVEEAPTRASAPLIRQVVLATEPIDAHVFLGESDLGTSPVVLEVEEGKPLELVIRRAGFLPENVVVNGSEGRLSVKLKTEEVAQKPVPTRKAQASTSRPTAPSKDPGQAKPKPKAGYGEIVNPWGD
jgi:serine/threonine-protein kinase